MFHREVGALGLRLFEVVPSREMRALAAQHHHVHAGVLRGLRKGVVQFIQHLLILRVALPLPGQQDPAHGAVVFQFECFVGHLHFS